MLRLLLAALPLLAATLPPAASAQSYPIKPVRIIVPAAPGGTSDLIARTLSAKLQESLSQPFIVEYKAGAGTNIGNDYVAKAAPDGYTLLLNGLPLATNPALYPKLAYDPLKDFEPIIELAEMSNVITVHPQLDVHSLSALVQQMRAHPDRYNYGTPGAGSSGHLSGELLALKTGARLTHIAYQGNAQAINDHLSGLLEVGFVNLPVALPFVQAGRLRPLALTSARRSALLPDVPTVAEALGIDYTLTGWFGLLAPAGTPQAVIATLQQASATALQDPATRARITAAGAEVAGGTRADFAHKLREDTLRLTDILILSGALENR